MKNRREECPLMAVCEGGGVMRPCRGGVRVARRWNSGV